MGSIGLGLTSDLPPMDSQENSAVDMEVDQTELGPADQVYSPAKVTRMASFRSGFSTETLSCNCKDIKEMIQQWINENGNHDIPAHLEDLAARAQVEMSTFTLSAIMPRQRDKRDKGDLLTLTTAEGARQGILTGRRFVLTGVWPYQGSGQGLTLGKERVKQRNEMFGGTVTLSISGLTDALVVGEYPGKKKIQEAHKRSMKIITIDQFNDLILGDYILEDLISADYPSSVNAVLDAKKIQVQCHPQLSVQHEQAQEGTARDSPTGHEDKAATAGVGHSNG